MTDVVLAFVGSEVVEQGADAIPERVAGSFGCFSQEGLEFGEGQRNHINGIENFWNQAKRHLRSYNGIPRQHFHLFIKEWKWRFNDRPIRHMQETLMHW